MIVTRSTPDGRAGGPMSSRGYRRTTCPECGSAGTHEDNGEHPSSRHHALCCTDCGRHWDTNDDVDVCPDDDPQELADEGLLQSGVDRG